MQRTKLWVYQSPWSGRCDLHFRLLNRFKTVSGQEFVENGFIYVGLNLSYLLIPFVRLLAIMYNSLGLFPWSPTFSSVIRQRKSLCLEPVWMLVDSYIHRINIFIYIIIIYHISLWKYWKYWGPVYIPGESFSPNRYILWD